MNDASVTMSLVDYDKFKKDVAEFAEQKERWLNGEIYTFNFNGYNSARYWKGSTTAKKISEEKVKYEAEKLAVSLAEKKISEMSLLDFIKIKRSIC